MNDTPLVSVIVPVYNTEKYLNKCVESILSQTHKNLEIWLVDDGSTDSCGKICDYYAQKDKRVHVIHKENAGQGVARNVAMDKCSGEYVSFVDSDDRIDSFMYEKMLLEINQSKAQIAICGSIVDNGFRLKGTPLYGKKEIWNNAELMKMYAASPYISAVPWNKLYSYELLKGIRFPDFRANEDAFIMHQILGRCKKAVYLNENLYIQYIRPGSTEQSRYSEKNMALLECAKNLQLYYKEKLPDLYEYVAYKYINDSASLLGKIVKSYNFYFYRKQYNEIYNDMCKEYKKISSEIPEDMRISSDAKCAIFHPGLFIVRSFGQGIVIKIKTIIKRCLGKMIRPLCYMIDSAN